MDCPQDADTPGVRCGRPLLAGHAGAAGDFHRAVPDDFWRRARATGRQIGGMHYIEYMVPGLIVLTTISAAYIHSAAGLLGARNLGYIEELLVAPQPRWIILAGYIAGGVARGAAVGTVATVIAVIFAGFSASSPWLSLAALLMVAVVSATGGCIVGLIANTFERVSMVQGLIVVPLAFVGGVFVPVAELPGWAQVLSRGNPVFYMVNAVRGGFTGVAEVPIVVAFVSVATMGAVLLLAALQVTNARLRDRAT